MRSYFKGLDDEITGFVHFQLFLTGQIFLQFEIHIGLDTSFKFTK